MLQLSDLIEVEYSLQYIQSRNLKIALAKYNSLFLVEFEFYLFVIWQRGEQGRYYCGNLMPWRRERLYHFTLTN